MTKLPMLALLLLLSQISIAQEDASRLDWGNVNRYATENQFVKAMQPDSHRVVFMGNSITEGWKLFDSSFFANRAYVNRGISGQTTSQMLVRFRADVIDLHPAAVVILAGTNDIAENTGPIPIESVCGNIVSMAQLAKANDIMVVLSSVLPAKDFPWRPGLQPAEKIVRLNTMIRTYCLEHRIPFVDYYSNMVDGQGGLHKDLSEDGVHPNLAGYKMMEPLVEAAIRTVLQ
jgi:lysophospholipase L1-like esterase